MVFCGLFPSMPTSLKICGMPSKAETQRCGAALWKLPAPWVWLPLWFLGLLHGNVQERLERSDLIITAPSVVYG